MTKVHIQPRLLLLCRHLSPPPVGIIGRTKFRNSKMTTLDTPSLFRGEMQLTPCEFQVCCELVNTPLVHKQIAAKLGKSTKTVEVQIASAYKKLGVTSRWELIQRFNSEREIPVKSLPSGGFVNGIMQRLDEIERVLNDLVTEKHRSPSPVRTIESITSVDGLL